MRRFLAPPPLVLNPCLLLRVLFLEEFSIPEDLYVSLSSYVEFSIMGARNNSGVLRKGMPSC